MAERADFAGCTIEERLGIVALEQLRGGFPLAGFALSPEDWSVLLRFLDATKRSGFSVFTTPKDEVVIVSPLIGRELTFRADDSVPTGEYQPRDER